MTRIKSLLRRQGVKECCAARTFSVCHPYNPRNLCSILLLLTTNHYENKEHLGNHPEGHRGCHYRRPDRHHNHFVHGPRPALIQKILPYLFAGKGDFYSDAIRLCRLINRLINARNGFLFRLFVLFSNFSSYLCTDYSRKKGHDVDA